MNYAMPTASRTSPIGVTMCSGAYWATQAAFYIFLGIVLWYAIVLMRSEQLLKIKYGRIGMSDTDIIFNTKEITKLLMLGFFGGFLAGAFGLGGGVIFNPILLTMGLPP